MSDASSITTTACAFTAPSNMSGRRTNSRAHPTRSYLNAIANSLRRGRVFGLPRPQPRREANGNIQSFSYAPRKFRRRPTRVAKCCTALLPWRGSPCAVDWVWRVGHRGRLSMSSSECIVNRASFSKSTCESNCFSVASNEQGEAGYGGASPPRARRFDSPSSNSSLTRLAI